MRRIATSALTFLALAPAAASADVRLPELAWGIPDAATAVRLAKAAR
jgi:hypothetical protein